MKLKTPFWIIGLAVLFLCSCQDRETGQTVIFPVTGEPEQITRGPQEDLMASYYGINL